MKVRVYVLGGVLGGLLAFGPPALAQGDTSGPATGGNVAPTTGTAAGGGVGVAGPKNSENGPAVHSRRHARRHSHVSNASHMGTSGGTSGPATGGNVAPTTGAAAGGAVGVPGPAGSENGPTPRGGSSNTQ